MKTRVYRIVMLKGSFDIRIVVAQAELNKLGQGDFLTFGEAKDEAMDLLTTEIDRLRKIRNRIWNTRAKGVRK